MGTIAKTEKIRLLFSAYNNMTRWAISFQAIAELWGLLRTVWRGLCVSKSLFASLYKRLRTLVLHIGAQRRCFIAKWNEAASSEKAFLWSAPVGAWSTALPYEAARCAMKRSLFRLHVFCPEIKKKLKTEVLSFIQDKNGGRSRTRIYDLHDVNVTL